STVNTPFSSRLAAWSAKKSAPGWVSIPRTLSVSVSEMPMFAALAPAYRAISLRSMYTASATWRGFVRMSAGLLRGGYQWTSAKSIFDPAMDRTVWFHVPASPLPTSPSGQFAGIVSTAPTLMDGSTAFMASEYATTPFAYPAGVLSAWLSASQL